MLNFNSGTLKMFKLINYTYNQYYANLVTQAPSWRILCLFIYSVYLANVFYIKILLK